MIWFRTFFLWWLAVFAGSLVWIALSNLAGVEPYTRGYVGGVISIVGLWVAVRRAQHAEASKTDGATGPSRVPGGAKSLISHPERR